MAEYIERTEELILAVNAGARAIENTKRYHGVIYCADVFSADHKEIPYLKAAEVLRGVDEMPAADVAPVVHGYWIDKPTGAYGRWQSWCSACGKRSGIGGIESNQHKPYCPTAVRRWMRRNKRKQPSFL